MNRFRAKSTTAFVVLIHNIGAEAVNSVNAPVSPLGVLLANSSEPLLHRQPVHSIRVGSPLPCGKKTKLKLKSMTCDFE
jgi:hypothetical protein